MRKYLQAETQVLNIVEKGPYVASPLPINTPGPVKDFRDGIIAIIEFANGLRVGDITDWYEAANMYEPLGVTVSLIHVQARALKQALIDEIDRLPLDTLCSKTVVEFFGRKDALMGNGRIFQSVIRPLLPSPLREAYVVPDDVRAEMTARGLQYGTPKKLIKHNQVWLFLDRLASILVAMVLLRTVYRVALEVHQCEFEEFEWMIDACASQRPARSELHRTIPGWSGRSEQSMLDLVRRLTNDARSAIGSSFGADNFAANIELTNVVGLYALLLNRRGDGGIIEFREIAQKIIERARHHLPAYRYR